MLSHNSISERGKDRSRTSVRTWVISLSPLREMAHFNKEDARRQNLTPRHRDDNPFISQTLQPALKKFTELFVAASSLHLHLRRLP
jgi:hypothetical protein